MSDSIKYYKYDDKEIEVHYHHEVGEPETYEHPGYGPHINIFKVVANGEDISDFIFEHCGDFIEGAEQQILDEINNG